MSLETGWSERSFWDPRENQFPVYAGAAASSVYGSYYCSDVLFKTRTFSRRLPVVALAAGMSALTSYNVWKLCALRPARAAEYGSWRSCPDCDKYQSGAYGFVINGITALMVGSAATTLGDSGRAIKPGQMAHKVPRQALPGYKRLVARVLPSLRYWQVAFASGFFGFVMASMKINHEVKMYKRAKAAGDEGTQTTDNTAVVAAAAKS
eukprot:scpid77129/ scgid32898/ 